MSSSQYNRVILMARKKIESVLRPLKTLMDALISWQIESYLEEGTATLLGWEKTKVLPGKEINDKDLLITLGGDGCFLNGAQLAWQKGCAILGINCGNFGFLTELESDELPKLKPIFQGNFQEDLRTVLSINCGGVNFLAVNEVALFAYTTGFMLGCTVKVDGKWLADYQVDGLMLATPTGATGHSMSAGGAILVPELHGIELVPVLSHNLGVRPIVLSEKSTVEFTLHDTEEERYLIILDGRKQHLVTQTYVKVQAAERPLRMCHGQDYDFYQTLRNKLKWN